MKVVILCGGQGTRMKEETEFKPKPLVLVGGKPILWHIMKIYAHHGHNEFILALGYKANMIKDYFLNWRTFASDFTLETGGNNIIFHNNECDDFKITFAETGLESLTGERTRRIAKYIGDDKHFMVTYGDGLADIDINKLVEFHKKQNTMGTITGVHNKSRFGLINVDRNSNKVNDFRQTNVKEFDDNIDKMDYVNGGFMVFNKEFLNTLKKDSMIEVNLADLADKGELSVYPHHGNWKCMDTYKEVEEMNNHWHNDPFWRVW